MKHKRFTMACVCTMFLTFILFCIWLLYKKVKNFLTVPDVPKLEDTWWGVGDPRNEDTSIQPFEINISEEVSKVHISQK